MSQIIACIPPVKYQYTVINVTVSIYIYHISYCSFLLYVQVQVGSYLIFPINSTDIINWTLIYGKQEDSSSISGAVIGGIIGAVIIIVIVLLIVVIVIVILWYQNKLRRTKVNTAK